MNHIPTRAENVAARPWVLEVLDEDQSTGDWRWRTWSTFRAREKAAKQAAWITTETGHQTRVTDRSPAPTLDDLL